MDNTIWRDILDHKQDYDEYPWLPFREGVDIFPLYEDQIGVKVALLRYASGASIPKHKHIGFEVILMLAGDQQDHSGEYNNGTLVINHPGSIHGVSSVKGCVVLAVWEQPVEFI